MSAKVHFDMSAPAPPAYSPPPAYAAHSFHVSETFTFAQKERMASIAEHKLGYLVSQKRREPSLRQVLLHAGFLERVLDSLDAHTVEPTGEDEPMIDSDYQQHIEMKVESSFEDHTSLSTIVEVDEMEVDEEEDEDDDEAFAPLQRTTSHRPGSPVEDDDDDEEDVSEDSDDELPSPLPQYEAAPDHPLFNLFEVREKARRDELSNHYKIEHNDPSNMFLMNNSLAVAA